MINDNYILTLYAKGARAVLGYLKQLDARITDAEARVERSQQVLIDKLTKELARTKQTLARKTQELIEQRQLNHQLTKRIRELEKEIEGGDGETIRRDSHNSSLPPSLDPPWKKIPRTRSLRKQTGMKVGGQPGHRGATLRQVAAPDEFITHTPDSCFTCSTTLHHSKPTNCQRRQVFDIADGRMSVTEHRAETKHCTACGAITKARFPVGVRAPVQYGCGVLARVVYLHLYQLLPVARTAEALRDLFRCHISPATVRRAGQISSAKLVKTEQRIKAAIRDSPVIGADETGLRVAGGSGYIHVARTDQLTHYGYDGRRGRGAMGEIGILPQFKGTLVRDGWASYKWYEQCRHSLCNAHLLRELIYLEEIDHAQKVWTAPLAKLLVSIKDQACEARANGAAQLSEQRQSEWRRRYDQLVKKAVKINPPAAPSKDDCGDVAEKRTTQSLPGSLVNRLRGRRDEILRGMTDLTVPFDNNGSERDLRMIKLEQKISGCFRTADGARNFCRVRSYLSTARKQGYALLCALQRVLDGKPLSFQKPAEDSG